MFSNIILINKTRNRIRVTSFASLMRVALENEI